MFFWNAKLKYKLNLKCEPLLLKLLLKFVLRRRKRSDCGVSFETLGIYIEIQGDFLELGTFSTYDPDSAQTYISTT